jgi:hypothetical protein
MSFGVYHLQERNYGITYKKAKMCKKTKHKYHSTQVQWRQAHNQAKQGLKEVENNAKPKSKHINCMGHHHRPGLDDHRRHPNEDGLIWAH